ncbi:diguanylate cyclase [Salipiger mucosus]|uniref:diguanylate cyclase n=1 Tax=Salipiger mucosus DSM 16094 TaxID=1123237 RepID=S9QVI8_9RHOB|nr:diguanylate cyclase [Salipiger mucosus]EPX85441.1 Pole remodelling regulatory diguanylate cyclase [Salipiger mucosus DSM 16094]
MTARILIADGVSTNRIVLRVKLKAAYYDVLQAGTGAEALTCVTKERPDLVIAAADLPDMEGSDFCHRLRNLPRGAETPVILTRGTRDAERRLRMLAAGADDVLSRPLDEHMLLARLRSLLRARHAEEELRLRDDTRRALGLADPPAGFEAPSRMALVPTRPDRSIFSAASALRGWLPDRIEVLSADKALRSESPAPEVFVIVDTGSAKAEGLALLTLMRGSSALRRSAIVYAASADRPDDAARALDLGANDVLAGGMDVEELAIRVPRQVRRKRTADRLRANMRQGLRAALTDPLTGLFNRRYALPHLGRLVERCKRTGRGFAVMVLDIDHFKRVNDRHGHTAGDAVLVDLAERLSTNLRAADLVARIGGEEFLVAMPDADREAAVRTAERLCRVMAADPVRLPGAQGGAIPVTLSIGVALAGGGACDTPEGLADRADRALYAAKNAGRNRVAVAEDLDAGHDVPPPRFGAAGFGAA